jgi:DNA-binding CsgD family transcriptional regulator
MGGIRTAALDRLLGELAGVAAAVDGTLAEFRGHALERLDRLVGFDFGVTWSLDGDDSVARGYDLDVYALYRARAAEFGPTIVRLLGAARAAGGAVLDRHVFGAREMAGLPLYTDLGAAMGGPREHVTGEVCLRGRGFAGLYLGRAGRLLRRFSDEEVAAVRRVVGVMALAEAAHRAVPPTVEEDPELRALTARERTLLDLFALGLGYGEAAVELGVSINTVRQFVRSIYAKLGVASKTEAVLRTRR